MFVYLNENYLDNIREVKYRIALSKFRVSSHNLSIETGRHNTISNEQRMRLYCNMNRMESWVPLFGSLSLLPRFENNIFKPNFFVDGQQ